MKRRRSNDDDDGKKPKKRKTSGLASTAKNCSGVIYGIWRNANYPNAVDENALTNRRCLYVGKVNREPIDRFVEHVKNDRGKPWHIGKGNDYSDDDDDKWPYVTRVIWKYKQITRFDVAAAEQFYMMLIRRAGGGRCNDRNELTRNKFDDHKDDDDVFTTKRSYPSNWRPVDIFTM